MAVISICECEDCYGSEEPCKEYSTLRGMTTTCKDERPSDGWCQSCQDYLNDDWEALKKEEAKEKSERQFKEGFGV